MHVGDGRFLESNDGFSGNARSRERRHHGGADQKDRGPGLPAAQVGTHSEHGGLPETIIAMIVMMHQSRRSLQPFQLSYWKISLNCFLIRAASFSM
jgi:hypothetical protein